LNSILTAFARPRLTKLLSGSRAVVASQVVFALGQAAILLILARQGQLETIGVFTAGLAIFSPLCLLAGLNSRTLIAIAATSGLSAATAFQLRAIAILGSGAIAAALLIPLAPDAATLAAAVLLVGTRAADQLSDVSIGFYQRDGRMDLIARSFAIRGLAGLLPFAFVLGLGGAIPLAAAAAALGTTSAVLLLEVRPLTAGTRTCTSPGLGTALREFLRSPAAFVPLVDSLHINAIRYALVLTSSADFLGLFGIAQAFFAPVQLLTTAIGYRRLAQARQLVERGDVLGLKRQAAVGLVLGGLLSLAFLLGALLIPTSVLALAVGDAAPDARSALLGVAVAFLFWAPNAMVGYPLIAANRQWAYLLAPLLGNVAFIASLALTHLTGETSVWTVMLLFSMSLLFRVICTLVALLRVRPL